MKISEIINYKYTWLVIKILISVSLLSYLLITISFNEILNSLKSAETIFVIIAVLLAAPINYLSAYQTHYLTKIQKINITILAILKVNLITSYYNLFLPGILSGGVIKWYQFSKHGSRSSAAAVVVINRFIETFVTILLGLLFFIPEQYKSGNKESLYFLSLSFLLLVLIYVLLFNSRINQLLVILLYKISIPKTLKNKAHNFLIAMHQFRILTIKDHFEVIGIVIFYNLIGVLSFYFFVKAMSINLGVFTIGWIRSALAIVSLLPFSFAGFGIREGSLIILLNQYGVAPHIAIALSLLLFIRNLLTAALGGVLDMLPQVKNPNYAMESSKDINKSLV